MGFGYVVFFFFVRGEGVAISFSCLYSTIKFMIFYVIL